MFHECCGPRGCTDCCAGEGRPCSCVSCCQNRERGKVAMQFDRGVPGASPMYYGTPRNLAGGSATHTPVGTEAKILEPLKQERLVEILKPEIQERVIEVPQKQYVDTIVEVPQKVLKERIIHVPKPVIHERVKHVKKPVIQETIVEVPQCKTVDKIVEVKQFVYEEKLVKVPKIIVQERVIPVPKKVIKERICEIPEIQYRDVLTEKEEEITEVVPEIVTKDVEYRQVQDRPYQVENVVEVPHVQHVYRNVMTPQYRHIPKPVEVPMTHYRPIPVEKIVDRNVPVPVELQIIQEYLCPKIEPIYKEQPVPIHVQRIIEHPVPKEAMGNPQLLPLYYQAGDESYANAFSPCCQPGGGLFSLSPCCASSEPRITQGTPGSAPVEVLAQGGYPGMPPRPQQPQYYQQGYPLQQNSERNFSVSSGNSMHMGMAPPHEEDTYMGAYGHEQRGNPYVQVSVSPNPPGVPTSVTMA